MKAIHILTAASVFALSLTSASAYKEIECSTDAIFSANSCDQCFEGGTKGEGAHLGLLSDDWENKGETKRIMYKEENAEDERPYMVNLDKSSVGWKQVPGSDGFWSHPEELEGIYSEEEEGYILEPGERVTWLKSNLGYAFQLEKNKAASGKNIGLLVYPFKSHKFGDDGNIVTTVDNHNECVLFKSGSPVVKEEVHTGVKPATAKKATTLPKTGPEHYVLLLLVAMLAGFGIMKLKKNA